MASFRQFNGAGTFIISEDSADAHVAAEVRARYPFAEVLVSERRAGLMASIDRLYQAVRTPFIFHLEDDWVFDGPAPWEESIRLLDEYPEISNVCVRAFDELRPKYQARSTALRTGGASVRIMNADAHPEFFGWSPNPGLIRASLYQRYAPFSRVMPDQMSALIKRDGGRMAYILPGVARHIGHGRNVTDPTMPPRPSSRPAKWLRAIKKKLYYAGFRKDPF